MKAVLSSTTGAETGALFHNAKDAAPLCIVLTKMGHPQIATPIQTDNACTADIVNNTVKQHSKATPLKGNGHFYCIKDRVQQGQYSVHWRKGTDNLTNYCTTHHAMAHH
jgi:hypothetical protein